MSIFELRSRTGLSQSKFAARFHLNVRSVRAWEQNARTCPSYVLWMIEHIMELEEKVGG